MSTIRRLVGLEGIIESRADYREGRPYIAGTGVSVGRIGVLYGQGLSAEQITREYRLELDQVHAALAYYLRNRTAIDADLEKQEADALRLAEHWKSRNR